LIIKRQLREKQLQFSSGNQSNVNTQTPIQTPTQTQTQSQTPTQTPSDQQKSKEETNVNQIIPPNLTLRENLIKQATQFLTDPKTQNHSVERKTTFLKSKNLTQEEINEAFKRSGQIGPQYSPSSSPSTNNIYNSSTPPLNQGQFQTLNQTPNQFPQNSNSIPNYQPTVVPLNQGQFQTLNQTPILQNQNQNQPQLQTLPQRNISTLLKNLFVVILITGFSTFGVLQLFKQKLLPYILKFQEARKDLLSYYKKVSDNLKLESNLIEQNSKLTYDKILSKTLENQENFLRMKERILKFSENKEKSTQEINSANDKIQETKLYISNLDTFGRNMTYSDPHVLETKSEITRLKSLLLNPTNFPPPPLPLQSKRQLSQQTLTQTQTQTQTQTENK